MNEALRAALSAHGFAVTRPGAPELAPEEAARAPWSFAARLLGEAPRMLERQPIKAVAGGRSFASSAGPAPLHTDSQMFAGVPPAVQIMACVHPAERGGACVLADAWALLDRIAAGDPGLYDLLFSAPRRIPFVFGDVFGPTVSWRGGALVFTHPPAPPADPVAARLAPFLDATPRIEVTLAEGEVLLLDNHRMLHGRRGFDGSAREMVRLLVWTAPLCTAPAAHAARAREVAAALDARLAGEPPAVRRRMGLAAPAAPLGERRLAVVLEMLRGVPPGVLAARERIPEGDLYLMRDAALGAAQAALAVDELPGGDDAMTTALRARLGEDASER